jgi:hypothetical protein
MRIPGVAALCALALSAGCSGDSSPAPATTPVPRPAQAAPVARGPTPAELTAGMVEAVAQGKSPLSTQLKFELTERPVVGQQLTVSVALIPMVAAAPATLNVSVISGLELAPGSEHVEYPAVDAAAVYRNSVRVTPRQEGVALLGVEVTLKHDDMVDTKAFSIPLLIAAK